MSVTLKIFAAHMPRDRLSELVVPLEVRNQTSNHISGRIWYEGSGYDTEVYLKEVSVKPGETLRADVRLSSKHHMTMDDVPKSLRFVLKSDGTILGRVLASAHGSCDTSWFVPALVRPFDPSPFDLDKFNVLLFGPAGSGKSSFANSLRALLQTVTSGEALRTSEPVHGGGGHCTKHVRWLPMEVDGGGHEPKSLPFNLIDTWGVTPQQYKAAEMKALMLGHLPHGWSMDEAVTCLRPDGDDEEEVKRYERRPHAVVLMLPVGELDDPNSELMQHMKTLFAEIISLGINPIVLLAKIDDMDDDFRGDPLAKNETKESAVEKAHKELAIPKGNIYAACNYLESEKKCQEIDRNNWFIAHRLASMCKHVCEGMRDEYTRATRDVKASPAMKKLHDLKAGKEAAEAEAAQLKADMEAAAAEAARQLAAKQAEATQLKADKEAAAAEAARQMAAKEAEATRLKADKEEAAVEAGRLRIAKEAAEASAARLKKAKEAETQRAAIAAAEAARLAAAKEASDLAASEAAATLAQVKLWSIRLGLVAAGALLLLCAFGASRSTFMPNAAERGASTSLALPIPASEPASAHRMAMQLVSQLANTSAHDESGGAPCDADTIDVALEIIALLGQGSGRVPAGGRGWPLRFLLSTLAIVAAASYAAAGGKPKRIICSLKSAVPLEAARDAAVATAAPEGGALDGSVGEDADDEWVEAAEDFD